KPYRIQRGHDVLEPFLARGWTGAVVPVATPAETIAALTILSFRPGNPIGEETIEAGVAIAGQAALAIDNARLYQQQKEFADTMQRSLLPREEPAVPGLEVGEVYESSARVDVGGEVACANAGHPCPRLVLPDGTVRGLDASGLVLGIDSGQEYEEVRAELPVGATIVLYTDGVVEARRNGELYGTVRLDALLVEQ